MGFVSIRIQINNNKNIPMAWNKSKSVCDEIQRSSSFNLPTIYVLSVKPGPVIHTEIEERQTQSLIELNCSTQTDYNTAHTMALCSIVKRN